MIVIVISGVLAAIAIPGFSNWLPKSRVNGAARELFTEMQLAKMNAVSENNEYKITFNTGNNSYKIHDDDNSDGAEDTGETVRTVSIGDNFAGITYGYVSGTSKPSGGGTISSAVAFGGSSPPSVVFRPTGLTNLAGSVYLKPAADTTRTDRQRAITVIQTGRVRLYSYTGSAWE